MDFDTAASRPRRDRRRFGGPVPGPPPAALRDLLRDHRQTIGVLLLVVLVLSGGALYASRLSEDAPRVVYSFALAEAEADAEQSLLVDINTADAERLQELPGVGPATAEAILEHRRLNGRFATVEALDAVPGIGPATLAEIEPLATV